MVRIKLIVEYDGTNYHGFQRQLNAHTVQAEIEQCLEKLTGEKITIVGAGRTDAGVHALGQVVAFDSGAAVPANKYHLALNSFLPPDIRVLTSEAVRPDFNPRFDAVQKQYRYLIYHKKAGAVLFRNYAYCYSGELNLKAMQEACTFIKGKHDFKAFCTSGSSAKTSIRTVKYCRLGEEDPFIKLEIAADGFLYNMVRIIAGNLMEIGKGRMKPDYLKDIIDSRDRSLGGPTAPPQGLYLAAVEYGD